MIDSLMFMHVETAFSLAHLPLPLGERRFPASQGVLRLNPLFVKLFKIFVWEH